MRITIDNESRKNLRFIFPASLLAKKFVINNKLAIIINTYTPF